MRTYLIVQYQDGDFTVYDFNTDSCFRVLHQNGLIKSYFPIPAESADLALAMGKVFVEKFCSGTLKTFQVSQCVPKDEKASQNVGHLTVAELISNLRIANGNVRGAARKAGISKNSFYRRVGADRIKEIRQECDTQNKTS